MHRLGESKGNEMIYLDNAASTPVFTEVIHDYPAIMKSAFPNASALHQAGAEIRRKLEQASAEFMRTLNINQDGTKIIWTSGGTEANNLAIQGYAQSNNVSELSMVTSTTEHSSCYAPMKRLQNGSAHVSWAKVTPDGKIDLENFSAMLSKKTNLVSICHVQNETGATQELVMIRTLMDKYSPRAKLHVDSIQAFGKIDIPWDAARIDLLSLSSHKIHGPGGVGALVIRDAMVSLKPLIEGGGQQYNLRSGSLDAAGILGFTRAAQIATGKRSEFLNQTTTLNRRLRELLSSLHNRDRILTKVEINSPVDGSPYILNFSLPGYEAAVIMRMLGDQGIIVGTGSACSAESRNPSRILTAMGKNSKISFGAIRVSFGAYNTIGEIEELCSKLQSVLSEY